MTRRYIERSRRETGRRLVNAATGPTVVIGAGPHGLAAVAHLRAAGVDVRCFGEPLEFWRRQMPAGMVLRSRVRSSSIADPDRKLTIENYARSTGRSVHSPNLTLGEFIDYGSWFQGRAAPDVDQRKVKTISRDGHGFGIELNDGTSTEAARVVVAAGISSFPRGLPVLEGFPRSLVSHASEHVDLTEFAGQHIAIVGAGQSALESAALLHERGAHVEVLARARGIRWLADEESSSRRRPSLGPPTDVGGPIAGWLAAAPDIFGRLPRRLGHQLAYRCIRPAGSGWLRPRLAGTTVSAGRAIRSAREWAERLELTLDDGTKRTVDHVLLATGYSIDVRRYPFLGPKLRAQLRVEDGYPVLASGLETSVVGLHILGAPAALSFGPVMRFVVGTWYDAPALTGHVLGRSRPRVRLSF
jgi:FAD-dependent urate hydroxylase